ncbi:cupredoxin domain-containing protein [Candidatus Nitrososphaera evergladensis]|uniref:cupredoxin domain-containing protein n=1 Tax=Candidatus Nitrososphaera evergladensis TaxID=1459637 RepID=UPI00221FA6B2|nr:hypothetical protein [Candidatus Nitrososphaera evergladensis]
MRWVNKDTAAVAIRSNDVLDSSFYNVTHGKNFLMPNGTLTFTFSTPGKFDYHAEPRPWFHGTIMVLPQR